MIEIIVTGILLLLCLALNEKNMILLIVFLLPFHSFIKSSLDTMTGSGNIFASWKEIAIIILLAKVGRKNSQKIPMDVAMLVYGFITIILFYYTIAKDHISNLSQLRDHIFPILFMIGIAKMKIDNVFMNRLIKTLLITGFISCIGGYLQSFVFNIQISTLKKTIDFVDESGYVQYTTNSARIMGFERMSGLFGGPNDFGVFCSFVISVTVGAILFNLLTIRNKLEGLLIYVSLSVLGSCLLLTFSRAGWGLMLMSISIMYFISPYKIRPKTIFVIAGITVVSILLIFTYFPDLGDIILKSVTFKEDSANDRGNDFSKGLEKVMTDPWGHGLGTADVRSQRFYEFAVESAFWNIGYEIGLLGLIYLVLFHFRLIAIMNAAYRKAKSGWLAIAGTISTISVLSSMFSINTYGMPYIYYWWLIIGIGLVYSQKYLQVTDTRTILERITGVATNPRQSF